MKAVHELYTPVPAGAAITVITIAILSATCATSGKGNLAAGHDALTQRNNEWWHFRYQNIFE